jgi:HTH-type transcriptional regulator/antitoxin HigA
MTLAIEKSRYYELIEHFPLRPLRSKVSYRRAMAAADELAVRDERSLSADERDYLETLSLLIENYENMHNVVDLSSLDPVDVLKHLMDAHNMTTTALGKLIGSKGIASEILSGKRDISKSHMIKIAKHFGVEPAVFLQSLR